MSDSERVAKLKEEGNTLFSQKEYASAAARYSEALELGGDNAILYSNRAACRLNLKAYLDAESDALKATAIDPSFAKAYARRATAEDALHMPYKSVISWRKSIDNLPFNPTSSQLKQKAEYEKGLAAATAALDKLQKDGTKHLLTFGSSESSELPWVCANRMIPQLMEQHNYASSAWALVSAHNEFAEGVREIFSATSQGALRFQSTTALTLISNAILTDSRVFHISDPRFIQKYNEQVFGEAQFFKAWTEGGPDAVKQETLRRLEEEGWRTTAPALSTTVRAWIMQGFHQGGLYQNNVAEIEYIERAIELIKWGREQFQDVRKEHRGVIFEETFLRGVQGLYLEALIKGMPNADDAFLDAALEKADEVIAAIDRTTIPSRESDPAFVSAYYYKPKGQAFLLKGMYYRTKGNRLRARADVLFLDTIIETYSLSSRSYLEAAECLAEDDETHAVALNAGLEMMWLSKTSARDQLVVMERVRLAIPKMKRIWAQSAFAKQGGDRLFKIGLEMEPELREAIKSGKFKPDDPVMFQKD